MLWREIQKNNFKKIDLLLDYLNMSAENRTVFLSRHDFSLNLPKRLAEKINKNDPHDPLLLQFLPKIEETETCGLIDPVEDVQFQRTPQLLQKYQSRALLITTSACAMHCRYCFRKNYPYLKTDFEKEIKQIQEDSTLEEILLSGGDPLSLSDDQLFDLLDQLEQIPHIQRIRFHTRFLIGIPERVHDGFLKKLQTYQKQIVFVIHVNHHKELDADVMLACKKLMCCGIPVLSQSVLLKGVNDNIESLVALFTTLINQGVIPYYLHQLDPVEGSLHFHVSIDKGLSLIEELRSILPGYGIPEYVQEIPHKPSKTPLHTLYRLDRK